MIGQEAWLANNLTATDVEIFASLAARAGVRRVVFIINIPHEHRDIANMTFATATQIMSDAGIKYTLLKHSRQFSTVSDQPRSFRVIRGELPLSTVNTGNIASEDLYKVPL